MFQRARRWLYDVLEARRLRGPALAVQATLTGLILLNVLAVVLETVEPIRAGNARLFQAFEIFSVTVFAAEYLIRLYAAVESPHDRFRHPLWGRLRFVLTPLALVDLAAILPIILQAVTGLDAGALRVLRLLRMLKLLRYSSSMAMLGRVVYSERRSLAGALVIFLVLLVLSSTIAYLAERTAQPKSFGSIPDAMWWAMAALTTVGYGDVTPVTTLGRLVGGFVVLLGIGAIALPTGIIASAFVEEQKRRDFVVTWELLANVPFFKTLVAPRLAELVRVLRPRFAKPDEILIHRGDPGDSMFIIASGEMEIIRGAGDRVVLGPGQFFGEMALIEKAPRGATVRAIGECKLLELVAHDFQDIMAAHPELREVVYTVAAERRTGRTRPPAPPGGDPRD